LDIREKEQEALGSEKRHGLFPSPDISSVMTARRIGWVGHVESECWCANRQERDHYEDLGAGGRTI